MPRVWVVAGALVGRSFELGEGAVLGRGEDCDLVLPEASVSRRHAVLERDGGGWALVDAGSRNGIRSGGRRVERCALADGDLVELGKVVLRFRLADGAAPSDGMAQPRQGAAQPREEAPRAADGDAPTVPLLARTGVDLRAQRRAELVSELAGARGGFLTGDLAQRPAWMRWGLYLVALLVAAAAFAGAFRLAQILKQS